MSATHKNNRWTIICKFMIYIYMWLYVYVYTTHLHIHGMIGIDVDYRYLLSIWIFQLLTSPDHFEGNHGFSCSIWGQSPLPNLPWTNPVGTHSCWNPWVCRWKFHSYKLDYWDVAPACPQSDGNIFLGDPWKPIVIVHWIYRDPQWGDIPWHSHSLPIPFGCQTWESHHSGSLRHIYLYIQYNV